MHPTTPPSKFASFRASDSGSALVEFSASAVLLMTVVLGIMDASRALFVDNFVSNVSREATRYAIVHGSTFTGTPCNAPSTSACMATAADVASYVRSLAPAGVNTASDTLGIATTWSGKTPSGSACSTANGTNSPGCTVQVTVTYSFNYIFPFMPQGAMKLTSTSAQAISQ